MAPKLQSFILRVTRRVVLLEHCIVSDVPISPTKSQSDLNYHIANKHSAPKPDITFKCKLCYAEFPGFNALCQQRNTRHGPQMGFRASNIYVEDIVGDVDDQSLREELGSCKYFLTDTEMENGRHRVLNFAMSSVKMSLLNDKLDYVFKELKCAAKVILAFRFVLKNIEDGMCRYFYAQENNTIMGRSKLVCTQADMTNLKDRVQKMDIVDYCTQERDNTMWKFYKLTTLTIFASLFKVAPMGCKDTILPELLLENHNVNYLTFERITRQPYNDNLCLFRQLALHLHGNEQLEEETSKFFNLFFNKWENRRLNIPRCSFERYSKSWRLVATHYLPLWHWFCGWRTDWGTSTEKYSKVWEERQTFTIQQSHLLRQQDQRIVQSLPVQNVWHIFLKYGESGIIFGYLLWSC